MGPAPEKKMCKFNATGMQRAGFLVSMGKWPALWEICNFDNQPLPRGNLAYRRVL